MRLALPSLKTLSSEITLVYTTLSITLVVLLTFISYRMNSRVLEQRIHQELLATVDQVSAEINAEIEERVRETQNLTLSPTLRAAARAGGAWTEARRLQAAFERDVAEAMTLRRTDQQVNSYLSGLKKAHPYIAEVFVTDRYGINAAWSNPPSDVRQNDEPWWQVAVQQGFYLSLIEYDQSSQSYAYSIAIPILEGRNATVGVVKAVYNLKAVQELVRSVRIGTTGYVVVLSHDNLVLSHPDADRFYRRLGELPDLAPLEERFAKSLRGVEEFETRADEAGHSAPWLAGHSHVMRPASVGPLNWTVVALVSRAEFVAPIAAVRNHAILAGLVFILAAVPIVVTLARRLLRPLEDLAGRAERIRLGELDVGLDVPSTNEIGRLADALVSMVENLKASHRRALDINAGLERTVRERTEELQRKNRQIEAQNKKVMEASRLKSQFLANMSHELRTPLNAVLALSDILLNEMSGPLNEEQHKQVGIINKSGASLLRLINDVLDLSRIEAGRMNVDKKPMSLRSLTTLVMDTLRPLAEDKHLALREQTGAGVPEFITGDENKLRQILINLLGNGIKFTDHGEVRMAISFQPEPPAISFAISDTGIGIAPDSLGRIFDEFQQVDGSTTRKYGGSGLGLTVSKKMAELMGGTLAVQSVVDTGSTFTLTVPYLPSEPVPATPVETLRRVRMQVPEPALLTTQDDTVPGILAGKPVVLVAEDELDTLYIMKKYLNKCGCQVVFARDGTEVLQKARTYKPIAIMLDLVLPRKTGWDVMSELKVDPETRNIPVIIASVLDNQERGFCLAAYRYLVKPVKETDITDAILQIQWDDRKDVKRILVIDDSMVDADLMARLLPESRYQMLRESDGLAGIATAARERPDLIMLDLGLPQVDGFQVLDGLRSRPETRDIPVVIYTARDLTDAEELRLRQSAQRVLLKNPLDPVQLLNEIADVLRVLPGGPQTHVSRSPLQHAHGEPLTPQTGGLVLPEDPATGRILLVEDDPANQYTIQLMLAAEGYEVQVADDGKQALRKIQEWRPDLVLMDMMMPVMGGHEATKALKSNQDVTDIPVIALTAAAMAGDREKALASGCDDYISKPVDRLHLLERVGHWLSRAQERGARGLSS